jgi:hypothetical protein
VVLIGVQNGCAGGIWRRIKGNGSESWRKRALWRNIRCLSPERSPIDVKSDFKSSSAPIQGFAMIRRFTHGSTTAGNIVVVDLDLSGTRMTVVQKMADGSTKRSAKEMTDEGEARSASEKFARELISRGYTERVSRGPKPAGTGAAAAAPKPSARARELQGVKTNPAFDDLEAPAPAAIQPLPRLAGATGAQPSADDALKKRKKKSGKRKKQKARGGDALDKRVLAGVGAVALALIAGIGFVIYDFFIKPPTIVATWQGGMVEHEISRKLSVTQYSLTLDDKHRAELVVTEHETWVGVGTYVVKGDRIKLTLKDGEGESSEREYKIALSRVTLELFEPDSGKLLVQLLRTRTPPVIRAKAPARVFADGIGDPEG